MITKTVQQVTSKRTISSIQITTGKLTFNSQRLSFSTCSSAGFLNANIRQVSNQNKFNFANNAVNYKSLVSRRQNFSSTTLIRNQANSSSSNSGSSPEPANNLDPYEKKLYEILTEEFSPEFLDVRDVSGGCGSMFYINIVTDKFNGLPLVKQHQAVNQALKEEIPKWHGLQLRTKALDKFKK